MSKLKFLNCKIPQYCLFCLVSLCILWLYLSSRNFIRKILINVWIGAAIWYFLESGCIFRDLAVNARENWYPKFQNFLKKKIFENFLCLFFRQFCVSLTSWSVKESCFSVETAPLPQNVLWYRLYSESVSVG